MAAKGGYPEGLLTWFSLVEAHAVVVAALERALDEDQGIPLPWFEVLMFLADADDGRMRMQDLAGSVLLSKSGVTRLVDRMVEAGLVDRDTCATDRRVVYAAITAAGRRALAESLPVHRRAVESAFAAHLSGPQLAQMRALARAVATGNGVQGRICPSGALGISPELAEKA